MLKSFLDSLEDPERPLLAPNYWILDKFGFIFPKHRFGRGVCVTLPMIVAFFVCTQYMELYITRSDLDEVLTNLRISMLSAVCVAKGFSFLFYQKEWLQIMDYVTESDKFERNTRDEVRGKILDKYTKYCRRITYFYWVLIFMTFFGTIMEPLMIYLSSATFREELRNGRKQFPHIFSAWVPFDKYSWPGNWITVGWHVLLCAWGGASMTAYDSNILVLLVFFGGKLDLIKERCRQMFGVDGSGISEDNADKVIRELHLMHVKHMKYMALQNSVMSPVMFLYVAMCALMLCATIYQLTTATSAGQLISVIEYLVFGLAQLFNFCWHCHDVLLKTDSLTQGLFESRWWATSVRTRKNFLLLMGQMNQKQYFSAGPFTNLTLPTAIAILKGAYSYYTLLQK